MCGWWVASSANPSRTLCRIRSLTSRARSIVASSGLIRMSMAVSSLILLNPSEDGVPVVLHADDRPSSLVCLGHRVLGAFGVGELPLGVVVVDEQAEAGDLEHRYIAIGVACGQERLSSRASPDVNGLAPVFVERLFDALGAVDLAIAILKRRPRSDHALARDAEHLLADDANEVPAASRADVDRELAVFQEFDQLAHRL